MKLLFYFEKIAFGRFYAKVSEGLKFYELLLRAWFTSHNFGFYKFECIVFGLMLYPLCSCFPGCISFHFFGEKWWNLYFVMNDVQLMR